MPAKFKGKFDNAFTFYGSFLQLCEKKKKNDFLKAYISGMAGAIYFRYSMCSLLICRRLHSKFGLAWSRDHGSTNMRKIVLCYLCQYTHVVRTRRPVFLGRMIK